LDYAVTIIIQSNVLRPTPNPEDQVPVFIFRSDRVAQYYPQAPGSLFIASYDSQGSGGGILTRRNPGNSDFMISNKWMIGEYELERVCKELVEACCEVLDVHLPGGTEEDQIIPQ
jgi:hypothetical protein